MATFRHATPLAAALVSGLVIAVLALHSSTVQATNSSAIYLPLITNASTPTPSPTLTPPPTATPLPKLALVPVSGYVKNGATGLGLSNAKVDLIGWQSLSSHLTMTNDAGFYSLTVPAEGYDLFIASYPTSPPYTYTEEAVPSVDASQATGPIVAPDILLFANTGAIAGVVTDSATGQPLGNNAVTVTVGIGVGKASSVYYVVNPTNPDGNGYFTIPLPPNGYAWAEASRTSCNGSQLSASFVVQAGQTTTVNISVPPCL